MQTPRLGRDRQQRFLKALAKTGNVVAAAAEAGVDPDRIEELRRGDPEFAAQWGRAEKLFDEVLDHEVHQRAIAGVHEPLVSDGKVVRDDDGRPIALSRHSDLLLLALLKARHPEKYAMVTLPAWSRTLAVWFVIAFFFWIVGDLTLRLVNAMR